MENAESFLRAAGIVITMLMAVLLLRDAGRSLVGRLGALFSLGVASYLVCSAPGFHELSSFIHLPLLTLCVSNPVFFWLLARALFDDAFRLAPAYGLLVVALLLGKAACALAGGSIAVIGALFLQAIGFGLAGHALWIAYAGRADDLSEERRAVRLPLVAGVGLYSVVILVAEIVLGTGVAPAPVRLIHVAIILSLAGGFALRLVSLRADDLLVPQSTTPHPADAAPQDRDIDAALLGRLNNLMEQQEAWREEGLTIGKLADQLGIPEYRLRRLINKGLGHRNFSSYVSRYRIEAARSALKDPTNARLPVLTIALDLGFGSIGPFNRAFKDATGMTPTEFRKAHLGGGPAGNDLADS
jgi:AraC-like DNA-binding protein